MAEALGSGDRELIGKLTRNSFEGACELYEIGAPAMHAMMAAMLSSPAVIGRRQAGAGSAAAWSALVEAGGVGSFAQSVRDRYLAATGTVPEVFPAQAAAGAGLI